MVVAMMEIELRRLQVDSKNSVYCLYLHSYAIT